MVIVHTGRSRGCKLCTKKNNTLLHIRYENNHSVFKTEGLPSHNQDKAENLSLHNKDKATTSKRNDSELVATNHSSNSITSSTHIFLPTAIVNIENSTGSLIPCRVLLD